MPHAYRIEVATSLDAFPDDAVKQAREELSELFPGIAITMGSAEESDADTRPGHGTRFYVVDFKSESLGGVAPAEAARRHAPQLDVYARALRDALDLREMPRREVWYVREGVVAEIV